MEIVTDSSVLLAVVLGEPERARLVEATVGHALAGPPCIPWEVGNAFSAMLRRKRLSLDDALNGIAAYRRIPVRLVNVDLGAALRIAADQGLYAYDAYYIVCALNLSVPLLRLDRRLTEAAIRAGARTMEV
ncbi:MAG: type II toxin-antitoxin system VapC family toxin [Armatimonadetes bacterium]|nr:type II toxin-antitoxin system VapC family toxin [Armatimonadota bacterium]